MSACNGFSRRPPDGPRAAVLTTPTGTQSMAEITRRRRLVTGLNIATYLFLMGAAAHVLGAGGWTWIDSLLLIAFAIGAPWTVLGFWNALIGLWLLHLTKDPMKRVAPFAAAADANAPIDVETAVLMTLRNEDPRRVFLRLRIVKDSLDATGFGHKFSYFILSDTDDPVVAAAEEAEAVAWKRAVKASSQIVYRRRTNNKGYKAGNVRDFCQAWGQHYALMLLLDADSLMSGEAVVRLVRIMQVHPKLGILQSLVVGLPSSSAFARIFQFGMRHAMRCYTMGQAWWVAECGPFWGHNALVRIAPFAEHCRLPLLPGPPPFGGDVLSHDQVEAALMRRAGFEVRVLPEERGSWEDNPPTVLEFVRRDLRWCQGNMQYSRLLDLPGLYPVSRFQLVWAILMFLSPPAWTLMMALLPLAAWQARSMDNFPAGPAIALYVTFLSMYLMPKTAGVIDAMLTKDGVRCYGGWLRFAAGAAIELVFSFLQGAVSTVRTTIFMIGLLFGKSVTWGGQARDTHDVAWLTAVSALWPQLVFGMMVWGALLLTSPAIFWWSLPLTAGYVLAVPFSVVTANPALGRALVRTGLCGVPEEFVPPPEVRGIEAARRALKP
jgi:membrane glycosyltransferase